MGMPPLRPAAPPDAGAGRGFTPGPARGRVYATSRDVRAGDVTPSGRLRLDAFARYLQEAAEDDVADTGWQAPYDWLLRRCAVSARGYPVLGDRVTLRTFCTGTGPRWAERTTTLAGPAGELMQATAIWVAIGPAGEPSALGPDFHRFYGEAAGGRRVSARLALPAPGPAEAGRAPAGPAEVGLAETGLAETGPAETGPAETGPAETGPAETGRATAGPASAGRPWPVRASDFDPAAHVNNTVHWQAAEDIVAGLGWLPTAAELEYHRPILPGATPRLLASHATGQALFWLVDEEGRLASGRLATTNP